MSFNTFFHYVSYVQYPCLFLALFFAYKPFLSGFDQIKENPDIIFESINVGLIFMGLGISFSSLQDATKTQNKLSRKIWESPRKGKAFLLILCALIVFLLVFGLTGFFVTSEGILKELSIGTIVLALGMFGMLKTAIEMFENHRKDKNP